MSDRAGHIKNFRLYSEYDDKPLEDWSQLRYNLTYAMLIMVKIELLH